VVSAAWRLAERRLRVHLDVYGSVDRPRRWRSMLTPAQTGLLA